MGLKLGRGGFGFGGGTGGSTTQNVYRGASPSTVTVNDIPAGTAIYGDTYDTLFQNIYAPYTAPTIALVSLTPLVSNYNEQNVVYNATFSWTATAGSGTFVSGQIQYKRGTDVSWTNLTTTINSVSSTYKEASATVTVNTSGANNDSVEFRCIFVDAQSNTSSTETATFSSYAAPTAALSITYSPTLSNGKMLRSLSTAYQALVGGTITRNSPNVNLSQYKIQRDYNDNTWIDVSSLTAIAAGGGSISPVVTDNNQPAGHNTLRYRAFVTDAQVPAGQAVSNLASLGIYQPVFFGMSAATTVAGVDLSLLSVVPDGTSGSGDVNYSNTSADKVINGLSYVASANRFCIAYPDSYGLLTTFYYVEGAINLLNPTTNFLNDTQSVTFADGSVITYRVYLYDSAVSSGTYVINTQ